MLLNGALLTPLNFCDKTERATRSDGRRYNCVVAASHTKHPSIDSYLCPKKLQLIANRMSGLEAVCVCVSACYCSQLLGGAAGKRQNKVLTSFIPVTDSFISVADSSAWPCYSTTAAALMMEIRVD
eukprot:1155282-Pelagomonas_calceolata.AAC.4